MKSKFFFFLISICLIAVISLIFKRKFSEIKNFMSFIGLLLKKAEELKKENKDEKSNDNINSTIKEYQGEKNIIKLINEFLENDLKINDTKKLIKNSKNKELMENWEIFKQKILIYYFSFFSLVKYLSLISLTNLTLIHQLKTKKGFSNDISIIILNELWTISKNSINHIYGSFKEKILNKAKIVSLQNKFEFNSFSNLSFDFINEILKVNYEFGYFHYFNDYLIQIENQIDQYENISYFNTEESQRIIIDKKLSFLKIYYDVISSELFLNVCHQEILRAFEDSLLEFKGKFTNNQQLSTAKILLILDENKIDGEEKDEIKTKNKEILNNYYKIISSIY